MCTTKDSGSRSIFVKACLEAKCAEIAILTDRVNKLIKMYKSPNKILRKFDFHNAQRYCDVNSNIDIIELINIAKNANIDYNSLANNNNSSFKRLLCAELAKYYDSFTTSDGICNNYDEWDLYDSEIYSQSNPGNFFIINPPSGESKCISASVLVKVIVFKQVCW